MTFLHRKGNKKHCILVKTTFEISLFLIKAVSEQIAPLNYYKYGYFLHNQQMRPSKNVMSTFVASSLVSFLNLFFSNYGLKILASSKDK